MADPIKGIVLEAVQYAVNDHVGAHIKDEYRASGLLPVPLVEVNDIAPSEQMIRVDDGRRSGPPRYFRVKVSEVM